MAESNVPMDKKAFTQYKVRSTRDADVVKDVEAEMKKTGAVRKTAVDMAQNQSFFTRPMEYRPEIASPDRPLMPKDLRQQYAYWRLFYAMDSVAGSVVDMYVEMSLSDYQIVGKGVDGEIRELLEDMCDKLRLLHLYGSIMKEFMVIGEAVPHLFYNATDRIWDDWSMHKPEQVTVLDTQLFGIDPILFLEPSSEELAQLRKIVKVAEKTNITISGRGFLQNLIKMKKIPLEPLNVSFIPRLAHVYDVRGTSLFQRLWRTWMYEDAVMSATINTAKRHSSPVKVVSIGDIAAGIVGTDDQEKDLLRALAQAELDPHAWITVPPGTKYEAWGTTDKVMGIRNEYEVIERMKLTALGVSKDVISGAASFASAQAGLQVLLSRLLALRTFHDKIYVEPKVFGPIVKIHDWSVPTQAEVSHKVKTRSGDKTRFVRPQIMWDKALKVRADEDLLKVYKELKDTFDMKISQRTVAAAARVDWADEVRKTLEEEVLGAMIKNETSGMLTDSGGFDSGLNDTSTGGGDVEDLAPAPESTVEEGAPGEIHASSRSKMAGLLKELKKLGDAGSRTPKVYDTFLVGDMKQKVHNQQDVSEARLIKGSTGEQYNTKGGTGDGKGKEGK